MKQRISTWLIFSLFVLFPTGCQKKTENFSNDLDPTRFAGQSANKSVTSPFFHRLQPQAGGAASSGYTPQQIRSAYGVDKINLDGAGITIAVVDAYDAPNIKSDLALFDSAYDLPPVNLTIAYPQGKPTTNSGWATETSLDVQWAHAMAPKANILLVLSKSANTSDMYAAVDYAVQQGAKIVSMSWGASESGYSDSSDKAHFNKSGVAFVAASGDSGVNATISNYPASSAFVIGVGGTTLYFDSYGKPGEMAWTGSGGGISEHIALPAYQKNVATLLKQSGARANLNKRLIPDLALNADPNTGVAVFYAGQKIVVGGTSLSAPLFAGVVALINQARAQKSKAPIGDLHNLIYGLDKTSGSYTDILGGCNARAEKPGLTCAATGYDLVTGQGSLNVDKLVNQALLF